MKSMHLLATICLLLGGVQFTRAQSSASDMVKEWERARAYTKAYLDTMPESGYALKPTPEMRSFAQQMLHLTDANYDFTSAITGKKSALGMGASEKTTDQSKANVTKLVLAGYDYVIDGIKGLSPAAFNEKIKLFGQFEMTRAMAFAKSFEHQTHHRGQSAVYIRLAGAKPPQEQLF